MRDDYVFPAVFSYDGEDIAVSFPDLKGCIATGDGEEEALKDARIELGKFLYGMEQNGQLIPEPSPLNSLKPELYTRIYLVDVYMPLVRERIENETVNLRVNIPHYLWLKAKRDIVYFSYVLEDYLRNKFNCPYPYSRKIYDEQEFYTYPAFFEYGKGEPDKGAWVLLPDVPGCYSCGNDDADTMRMIHEGLGMHLSSMITDDDPRDPVRKPTPLPEAKLDIDDEDYGEETILRHALIDVYIPKKRYSTYNRPSDIDVNIPRWLNDKAEAEGLNLSHIMTEYLYRKYGEEK